jgi:hypothetical protein
MFSCMPVSQPDNDLMDIDSTVSSGTTSVRKRRAQQSDRAPVKRNRNELATSAMAEIEQILQGYEEQAANTCADSSSTSVWIALNVVLDNSTFHKSLLAHDLSCKMQNNVVPVVTRTYEESYMRECMHEHDKPCRMGQYCECNFIDEHESFVGVTFVMPEITAEDMGLCVLCLRKLTQMLFYRVQKGGYWSSQMIQVYGNVCDTPGEYHSSAMLIMPAHGPVHSMPLPVVAHQRNKYYVVHEGGCRRLRQRNVYVEDFC